MPTYEYVCEKCKKNFSLLLSITEHEKKKIRCPECKSTKTSFMNNPKSQRKGHLLETDMHCSGKAIYYGINLKEMEP